MVVCAWLCASCAMPVSRLPELPAQALAAEEHSEKLTQARAYHTRLARIDNVAFRIRVANRQFCQAVAAQIGLRAATVRSLPKEYRYQVGEALNVDLSVPTVIAVADRSPAATAGIKRGDQVLALDGKPVPAENAQHWIDDELKGNGMTPVTVTLRRGGTEMALTVSPVMGCAIPIQVGSKDAAKSRSKGAAKQRSTSTRIVIPSAAVALAKTDDQLAIVIGHELAHANLGHVQKREQNAWLGKLGGAAIDGGFLLGGIYTHGAFRRHFGKVGAKAYGTAFEREADYVGAYYAARAGYDVSRVVETWRALRGTSFARNHPLSPARFIEMREVVKEIAEKQQRHLPLIPELKESAPQAAPAAEFIY